MTRYLAILFLLSVLYSPAFGENRSNSPYWKEPVNVFTPVGKWRGVFTLKNGVESPFLFEITGEPKQDMKVYFINGEERFEGGTAKLTGDSLYVYINQFDNEIAFRIEKNVLTGVLRKQDRSGYPVAVHAEKGDLSRFPVTRKTPSPDISGTYDIVFKNANGQDEKAVGLFKQEGNLLKATFLRITGDSRYLDGIITGNRFYLSTFIGSSPAYYHGTVQNGNIISGEVVGSRSAQMFEGRPNEEASLPDAGKLTFLKTGYTSLDFSFPDINGKKVSLKDGKFKNKVVILTITGTWCPNCIDEATFLAPWYTQNKERGVEVLALHYERKNDSAYARKAITRFRQKYGITYDAVFAGIADKQFVAESLPALNSFLSFPTIIIIGKQGQVAKIHTGFSGPATGKYYDQFVKSFNDEIDQLLKE